MVVVVIALLILVGLHIASYIYSLFDECSRKADRENFIKDWKEGKKYAEFYRN